VSTGGTTTSFTMIDLALLAMFPALSVTVYITSYVPAVVVSGVPVVVIVFDISPSTVSKAVAPCSVYVSPTFRFIV
jgi:hypothetical protein